ncbi:MAG TPA: prephenate dehydratase [Anaerolineaceae bacterium]
MGIRVAYQGEPGAYSEAAAIEYFGGQAETFPQESFEALFAAVESGACEFGLVPIENSLAGSIHQNYDLLQQHTLAIVGEHLLRVHHCLIGLPGADLAGIRRVISHPQALAQSALFLRALPGVKVEAVYDTAGSVKMVLEGGDPSVAAVASSRAAETYRMRILAEGIEDDPANFTRFLVISRTPVRPGEHAKTSIVFSVPNVPGSLYKALGIFATRGLDLTKIESRPMVGKPWEYLFYIDFNGSTEDPRVLAALGELEQDAAVLRVLGSYPRYKF